MTTFWEIADHSVDTFFSLYFVYLYVLVISHFGFESGICLLIAPVPVHCFLITFFSKCLSFKFSTLQLTRKTLSYSGIKVDDEPSDSFVKIYTGIHLCSTFT